ncbi:MAG: cell division protein ZapA [Rhodospirillales bacterium]|nr:cell division protein ZapA [Alphaproteobacteria bacterium]MCB9987406.1 cell division protein ZapA [Rhodospirillales bacterium]USO07612.1 MAG: cell division protein ZapA [Rhodospirillales bacterium]
MSKTTITVNNRPFTIACDDGQESRVQQLGAYVDERFKELQQAGAAPNETYGLVLTALVIADDMFESRDAAQKAAMQAQNAQAAPAGPTQEQIDAHIAQVTQEMAQGYERRIAEMSAEIDRLRRESARNSSNVTDINRAREEAEAKMQAREAEIAKAVDNLTDRLETVVKKLKRA